MVRPDYLLRDAVGQAAACPCGKARGGPQMLFGCNEVSLNDYFFFFLAVFFAFFAFLAMLPSVIPKVGSMQVDNRHAYIQTTPQLQN
jgi:hypothetical protein